MHFGCQSEFGQIKTVLLKHPGDAFINQKSVDSQWEELNYLTCPDFHIVLEEYQFFESLLKKNNPQIYFMPMDNKTGLDSIYIRDPVIMINKGAVLGNMGKKQRQAEPSAVCEFLETHNIPILGAITGNGTMEAGDVVVFDHKTIAVGHSYRTNGEGIRQFKNLTVDFIEEFVTVPLPHWNGPDNILHLMSLISPIDHDLAVVYPRLLPIPFRNWLIQRRIKMIEVPDSEYLTMGCNILATAPRNCIMISGNPETKKRLQAEGVEVQEFSGEELCKKGGGGPTCLTRPLYRMG